jgi:hypothetical protein
MEKVVFVKCHFSRGSFPTEYIFHIVVSASGEFYGTAPTQYCLAPNRAPLGDVPEVGEVAGLVVGVTVPKQPQGALVRVYLPNGEVYDVGRDQVEYPEAPERVPLRA